MPSTLTSTQSSQMDAAQGRPQMMKAIAVFPGQPGSVHLAELPMPSVTDIPGGRGVLVRILRVGVDGTDKEINAAEYGEAPEGSPFLVLGHESFGVVEEVGARVTEVMAGDYVVATVRRPGMSIYDRIGTSDMTTDDVYFERGISRRHGFLTEHYVEEPVPPADPPLEVHVVGRHVGRADAVVDAHPGPAHRRDHVVARHQLRHPCPDLLDYAETLVAQRQK